MGTCRTDSKRAYSVAAAALIVLTAACGASDTNKLTSHGGGQSLPSVPLASAKELHRVFGADRLAPTVASVAGGALVIGGAVMENSDDVWPEIRPLGDVFWIDNNGQVTDVGPLPTPQPLVDISVSTLDETVLVTGVTCQTGSAPNDVGETNCEPGQPELLSFDSSDFNWRRIDLPDDAPTPADSVGAVAAHSFNDGIAYSILGDVDMPVRTWVTTDELVWTEISVPDDSGLCATNGGLLAVDDHAVRWPVDDGPITIEPPLTPDTPLTLKVRRFDSESGSWAEVVLDEYRPVEIVRGGTIGACTAEAGYVTLNLIGGQHDALVSFFADGRTFEFDAFEGHRVAAITPTSGSIVLVHAEPGAGVFAIDTATGETRLIGLPEDSRVVGSLSQEFVLVFSDQLTLVDL